MTNEAATPKRGGDLFLVFIENVAPMTCRSAPARRSQRGCRLVVWEAVNLLKETALTKPRIFTSLARVSEKREYFKCRPETIGDFAPKLFKLGV